MPDGSLTAALQNALIRVGLAFVVVGILVVALASFQQGDLEPPQAGGDTTSGQIQGFADALARIAKTHAIGVGATAMGLGPLAAGLALYAAPHAMTLARRAALAGIAALGGLGIGIARWQVVDAPVFGTAYARWLTFEGAAWVIVGIALAFLVVPVWRDASPDASGRTAHAEPEAASDPGSG